jgi:hypothetical protein
MRNVVLKTGLSLFLLFFSFIGKASYNVTKRYSLLQDRLKTQDILVPFGRNVYADFRGTINTSIFSMINDAKGVTDLTSANSFISRNNGTEQGGSFSWDSGTPLPRFKLFGMRFYPQLGFHGSGGVALGFQEAELTRDTILAIIPSQFHASLPSGVPTKGQDLGTWSGIGALSSYKLPENTMFHFYGQFESNISALLEFSYRKRYYGHLKFYTLVRQDTKLIRGIEDLSQGGLGSDFGGNLHANLTTDLKLGYRKRKWRIFYQLEGLPLVSLLQKKASSTFFYGENLLMRLHGDYKFKAKGLSFKTFAGAHYREDHYGWSDGFYIGGEFGASAFRGSLGLKTSLIVDPEHWNIALKLKGWIGHIHYLVKFPFKNSVDGVRVSSFHTLNFRLFF